MLIIFLSQLRAEGTNPKSEDPLPGWFRSILLIQGVVMMTFGLGMLITPLTLGPLWPWNQTALTTRAIGAWLIGIGSAAVHSFVENSWSRIRPAIYSYTVFGSLQLVNLVRYPDATGLDFSLLNIWIYSGFLVSIMIIGIFGSFRVRQI
jgi:hypothetical protein